MDRIEVIIREGSRRPTAPTQSRAASRLAPSPDGGRRDVGGPGEGKSCHAQGERAAFSHVCWMRFPRRQGTTEFKRNYSSRYSQSARFVMSVPSFAIKAALAAAVVIGGSAATGAQAQKFGGHGFGGHGFGGHGFGGHGFGGGVAAHNFGGAGFSRGFG